MTNPEIEYRRLVSAEASAIRTRVQTLEGVIHDLAGVREDLAHAQRMPVWSGGAATAFAGRMGALHQGLATSRSGVVLARYALEAAAGAYETVESHADHYIAFWRNRPDGMPAVIEELFARVVNGCLLTVGSTYNQQLSAIGAVLTGDDPSLDQLDEETRKWVEEGLAKNEKWLEGNDSELGPRIPNTAANGDDRGWIPQGLGYDPTSGTLLQGYYTKDDEGHGKDSYLALVDEVTGREVGEVKLGDSYIDANGNRVSTDHPKHAGGVTVDGDKVYVTDNGKVFTYSLDAIRKTGPGQTVPQERAPQSGMDGGSYSAMKDGKLYLGDHEDNKLYVYERSGGEWVKVETIDTPPKTQGVLVRDDELVFSSSAGRHQDHSQLIVQDHDGNRSEPYELPSMSQGVVEVDGELVVTYESGAGEFDSPLSGTAGWWWGRDDYQDLWGNPFMTRTPLSELGLGEDYDVEPGTLLQAAGELSGPTSDLKAAGADLDAVTVPGHLLGEVPQAAVLAATVRTLVGAAADSLRTGAAAVGAAADLLGSAAQDYARTDEGIGAAFVRGTPD
ncbi:hypothetical protein [Nocardioides sp. 616]|uniref:hypothetical protein n=1 Tax=Nocardioides sp. 616 TaxID=2268090 RepID=UPI000CE3A483|nr:hypothetical protein [Nocardioides sp. 616]